MNFIDAYDITGPTATPPPREGPEPTLNEEVTQVVGQLSRFWGGFRKQSQSVLESARKDLTQVVSQAQKELTKLTTEPAEESTNAPSEKDAATSADSSDAHPAGDSSSGPSTEAPTETSPTRPGHTRGVSVSATAQNLFSRLQASLPADLAATVQAKLPESIKQGAGSIDLGQLRTTLASEFQRVQNITKAQAEEYAHKSEELLRDAGEFFKEAVKVVPPEGGSVAPPGVLWDGTDIWMLPEVNAAPSTTGDSKGKGKERESKSSAEGLRAVATRAEALLKQLKHDPEVIKADPEADEKAAKLWKEWYSKEIESKDGGIDSVEWQAAVKTALADPVDGGALQRNLSTLVPDVITRETFWTRYFFRVHQVESEEQRRKALLQNTAESEEDFDWESDEDDESSDKAVTPQGRTSSLAESTKTLSAVKPDTSLSTTTTNSRVSSEDGSYDVVSSQVSNADETGKPEEQAESGSDDEDDEDDDDEEEEGDDDDDDDSEEDEEEAKGDEQQTKIQVAKPPATAEAKATKVPQAKAGDDDDDSDWE
ncbi:hypothetical protein BC629DRAFT_1474091 [Irpex lacteus]|nr:hypothetical protein BC629DRAFT_1474091 [Irpex lacteus]